MKQTDLRPTTIAYGDITVTPPPLVTRLLRDVHIVLVVIFSLR